MKNLILIMLIGLILQGCATNKEFTPRNIPKPPVVFSMIDK